MADKFPAAAVDIQKDNMRKDSNSQPMTIITVIFNREIQPRTVKEETKTPGGPRNAFNFAQLCMWWLLKMDSSKYNNGEDSP